MKILMFVIIIFSLKFFEVSIAHAQNFVGLRWDTHCSIIKKRFGSPMGFLSFSYENLKYEIDFFGNKAFVFFRCKGGWMFDAGSLTKITIEGKSKRLPKREKDLICQKIADYFLKHYSIIMKRDLVKEKVYFDKEALQIKKEQLPTSDWYYGDWKLRSETTVGGMTCPSAYSSTNFIIRLRDIRDFR